MATLTEQQIAIYAWNAGFRGSEVTTATAIAMAESQGNTLAYNPETAAGTAPGWGSYGLWQVYRTAHPKYNPSYLDNPADNAQAAYSISGGGTNWNAWTTYTGWTSNGYITPPYLRYLSSARQAVISDFGTPNPGNGPYPGDGSPGGAYSGGGGSSGSGSDTSSQTAFQNPFGYACGVISEAQSIRYGPFATDAWNIAGVSIPYGDVLNVFYATFQRSIAALFGIIIILFALALFYHTIVTGGPDAGQQGQQQAAPAPGPDADTTTAQVRRAGRTASRAAEAAATGGIIP